MRKAIAAIVAWCAKTFDVRDVMLALGLLLLSAGLWFVWPPASLIVPGAVLSAVAILGQRISAPVAED